MLNTYLLIFVLFPISLSAQFASTNQYSNALKIITSDPDLKKAYGTKKLWVSNEIISWAEVATMDGPLDIFDKQESLDLSFNTPIIDSSLQSFNKKKLYTIINFTHLIDDHLGALVWIDYNKDNTRHNGAHYHFIFKFHDADIVNFWKQLVFVD